MFSLMRRLKMSVSSKLSFAEFAQAVKPQCVEAYISRITKMETIGRDQHMDQEKSDLFQQFAHNRTERKKPLTAFSKTQVFINRDSNRTQSINFSYEPAETQKKSASKRIRSNSRPRNNMLQETLKLQALTDKNNLLKDRTNQVGK